MKKTVSKILIISLIMAIMPAQMVLASENDSEIVETGGENTKTGTGEFTYEKGYYYDADGYIEGDNYLEDDGWTIAITGYSGEATGDVVIPNNIEGHMVTYIKDDAFKGCSELTSVILPDGLKFIGKRTFEGCSGLTNITLPDGLEFIGGRAFAECSGLTSVILPDGLSSIGEADFGNGGVFEGCSGLTNVTFPESLTTIENGAFKGCSGLTSVILPEKLSSIGYSGAGYEDEGVFEGCSGLTNVTFPGSLTTIKNKAFKGCSGLTNVTFPESLTTIEENAFAECSGLTNVTFPESLTTIGEEAFVGCSGLTNVTFSEGLTTIRRGAFAGCSGLTNIAFPESLTDMGWEAFSCCSGLTSVIFPEGLTSIRHGVFFNCGSLTNITFPKNLISIESSAFFHCNNLTSVILPESVTSIGSSAFAGCENLKSIEIPNTVTDIGSQAFGYNIINFSHEGYWATGSYSPVRMANFTIHCGKGSVAEAYAKENYFIYKYFGEDTCTQHSYTNEIMREATCISDGIRKYTCTVCGNSYEETIPATGHDYKTAVTKATVNQNGSITTKCSICGDSITTIINAPKNIRLVQTSYYFDGNVKKPAVTVKDSNGKLLNEKTDYDVTYPAGRKNIGSYSVTIQFKGNYEGTVNQTFKIVEKKNAIFTVKNNQYKITGASTVAFTGVKNSKTKKVTIPDTVTYGGKSFKVTSIADKALKKSALTSATIGKNVKTIGASAFEGCRKLNSVTVGKNVAKIGKNAFKGCKKLKLITIKSSKLKTVGSNAFKGIHSKAKIKVPAKKLSAYKKLMKGKGQGKKVTIVK